MKNLSNNGYFELLAKIKHQIQHARIKAHLAANKELILLYWNIGKTILDRQKEEGWGAKVIDRISSDLKKEFPEMKGLSSTNLKYMKALATKITYGEIGPQLVDQIPWGHIRCLIDKCKEKTSIFWYIQKTIENGWSRNVLNMQIKTELYKRQNKGISNFETTLPKLQSELANSIIKALSKT